MDFPWPAGAAALWYIYGDGRDMPGHATCGEKRDDAADDQWQDA